MPLTTAQLYAVHVQNLRAVDSARLHVYRQLKHCIAANENSAAIALLKTLTLLIGSWAEVRLLKLLHEPNGFSDAQRGEITSRESQLDRWKHSLQIGIRHAYHVPRGDLTRKSLPVTAFLRYSELMGVIENDLRPVIEIRNKLAHGQWARTLNKHSILEMLSRVVHDLVTSVHAFDRDFDEQFRILEQLKTNLVNHSYADWANRLRHNLARGRAARAT